VPGPGVDGPLVGGTPPGTPLGLGVVAGACVPPGFDVSPGPE